MDPFWAERGGCYASLLSVPTPRPGQVASGRGDIGVGFGGRALRAPAERLPGDGRHGGQRGQAQVGPQPDHGATQVEVGQGGGQLAAD
ncbi:MAG TPA: hypothetical protein VFQ68_21990, partial [Streptosporangiaceae bacterium]|nr:hypothetical protein [Streptosporangiaceae bacterium]